MKLVLDARYARGTPRRLGEWRGVVLPVAARRRGGPGERLGAAWGRRFGPWQSTSAIGAPPFVLAGGIVGSCGRRVRWSVAVCLFLFLFRGGEGETVIFFLFRCFSLLLSFEHKRKKMVVLFFCIA